jgi:amidase
MPADGGPAGDATGAGELHGRSAVELARLVATGQLTARELVQEAIDRIEARADLNVIAYKRFEAALAEANRPTSGPFAGVPLLLKDLGCDIDGVGTSMGSALVKRAGLVASEDAELVRRLKAAGFIVLGRTTSPEFGISSSTESVAFGTTHNPWGRELSAGGSSGGSAAAVAAGLVPMAQGSDGAGSLRMPAALCGVAALKPTHGRISQSPDWEVMMGHNDNGAIARHIVDLAGFLDVTEGCVPGDPAAHRFDGAGSHLAALQAPLSGAKLRIGLFLNETVGGVPIEPAVRDAVVTVGGLLASAGHTVEDAWPRAYDEPELLDHFIDAIAPSLVDLLAGLGAMLGRPVEPMDDLEPVSRYWYERGSRRTAGDLAGDLRWLGGYRRRLAGWWSEGWDLLVAPSFPTATRLLGLEEDGGDQTRRNIDFVRTTVPFNTSGQPAVTLPAVLTDKGPIGVQLVGAPGHDRLVLLAASELAAMTGSAHWYPPVQ